jgi:spoIIIJ-associated protein
VDKLKLTENLAQQLLEKMNHTAEIAVSQEEETIRIELQTDDPGLLIGFHGKTLSAMQLIFGLMLFSQLKEWQRVVVDVNDYRQEQTDRLKKIALNAAQKAKFSGQSVALSPMTPFERRVIHLALNEDEEVETKSEGEASHRYVVISPKAS